MSFEYCENLKKIELHAHLNGSLSVKTIGRLGMYVFYNILFMDFFVLCWILFSNNFRMNLQLQFVCINRISQKKKFHRLQIFLRMLRLSMMPFQFLHVLKHWLVYIILL